METGIHLQDSRATARAAHLHDHGGKTCWTLRLSETAEAAELGDEVTVFLYRDSVLTLAEAVLEAAVGLGVDLGDLAAVRLHLAAQVATQPASGDVSWAKRTDWEPIDPEGVGVSYRSRWVDSDGAELTVELDGTGTLDGEGQVTKLTAEQVGELDLGPGGYPDDSEEAYWFTEGYSRCYYRGDNPPPYSHPGQRRDPAILDLRIAYDRGILAGKQRRLADLRARHEGDGLVSRLRAEGTWVEP